MIEFVCEKTLLQNAASVAARAVSSKSSIAALEGLLISASDTEVTIAGYNMSTGIRSTFPASITSPGEIVVNTRLFSDIIRRMPDDMISLTVNPQMQVHLECGETKFDISGIDAADFPELPNVEEEHHVTLRQDTFRAMIEQCAFSVSTNESRLVHTGALFEIGSGELTMVAVDGFRLALRREPLESASDSDFSFVVPGPALNELKTICTDTDNPASITLGKRHILFEINNTELICRRLEGDFLDYRRSIPRDNPIRILADTKELISSLDRVSVVISEKVKGPVRCTFQKDRLLLAANTLNGLSRDVCRIDGDGEDLEIGFNNRYLLDALRNCPADVVKIELKNSISPAVIVPEEGEENFLYMILPVRIKAESSV